MFNHNPHVIVLHSIGHDSSIQPEPLFHHPFDIVPLNRFADFPVYRNCKTMVGVVILHEVKKKKRFRTRLPVFSRRLKSSSLFNLWWTGNLKGIFVTKKYAHIGQTVDAGSLSQSISRRQTFSSLSSSSIDDLAATLRGHAFPKPVGFTSFPVIWLKCSFHVNSSQL